MGLLSHVRELVKDLYPHAANYLGRAAVKAAEALQNMGVSSRIAQKALDMALENIPSTKTVITAGKVALDMYGEFKRDSNAPAGFIPGAPAIGGMRPRSEYPGYYTKSGQGGLGGGFGRKKVQTQIEYNDAFPGNPNAQPEVFVVSKSATASKVSKKKVKSATASKVSKKKVKSATASKDLRSLEMEPEKKKKKKARMVPVLQG